MIRSLAPLLSAALLLAGPCSFAESCTTQSALPPADRTALAEAARALAAAVQSNDVATLRASSTPDLQKNFGGLQYLVAVTSPKLAGGAPQVEQLYVLDASSLKPAADGSTPQAQFFCTLNNSVGEAQFAIAGLTAGRYAFAMVTVPARPSPWRLSMLLRQQAPGSQARWLLAGIYPKPLTLAGHDGLWFWTEARRYTQRKQPWNAWLFYQTALTLLRPADFVLSTHLDKLQTEASAASPPALSEGISAQTPLVLRSAAPPSTPPAQRPPATQPTTTTGAAPDLRFTGLALAEPAPGAAVPLLSIHLQAEPLADPAAARQRSLQAVRTLFAAYPELRAPFQSVTVVADTPGQTPLTTEIPIAELR
ncbi:MAG: hypothetical protein M3O02_01645 [Acidobacteriota bacterium]|nr:hypothetical protein [Acidobacteriota bacterium]